MRGTYVQNWYGHGNKTNVAREKSLGNQRKKKALWSVGLRPSYLLGVNPMEYQDFDKAIILLFRPESLVGMPTNLDDSRNKFQ